MTALRMIALSGWVAFLPWSATAVHGQEKNAPGKSPDAETIAAFEKLGAEFGKLRPGKISWEYTPGPAPANTRKFIPAFRFKGELKTKLPEVAVPFGLVFDKKSLTDAELKHLAGQKNLVWFQWTVRGGYFDCHMTDTTLRTLRELGLLHTISTAMVSQDSGHARPKSAEEVLRLDLHDSPLTDAGLKELAGLKNLTRLQLHGANVTDAGVKELAAFKKLSDLGLEGTNITDVGLKELAGFTQLQSLDVHKTKVTAAGAAEFRKALTRCSLRH